MSKQPIQDGDEVLAWKLIEAPQGGSLTEILRFERDSVMGVEVAGLNRIHIECPCCGWKAVFPPDDFRKKGEQP